MTIMMSEGCLTFPYLFLNIKRPRKIQVQYEDDEGKEINRDFEGMYSHESINTNLTIH